MAESTVKSLSNVVVDEAEEAPIRVLHSARAVGKAPDMDYT
jgi:hypothetical protein